MRPYQAGYAVALLATVLALGACGRPEGRTVRAESALTAPRPSLWRIEAINDGQVVRTIDICADAAIQAGFSRPAPEFKGQPCDRAPVPVEGEGAYVAKCRMDHNNYVVSATRTGDPQRDFTVKMAVARQDRIGPTFEQTRRYTRQGDCPAGWRIGDAAGPGDQKVANTLAPGAPASGKNR